MALTVFGCLSSSWAISAIEYPAAVNVWTLAVSLSPFVSASARRLAMRRNAASSPTDWSGLGADAVALLALALLFGLGFATLPSSLFLAAHQLRERPGRCAE